MNLFLGECGADSNARPGDFHLDESSGELFLVSFSIVSSSSLNSHSESEKEFRLYVEVRLVGSFFIGISIMCSQSSDEVRESNIDFIPLLRSSWSKLILLIIW